MDDVKINEAVTDAVDWYSDVIKQFAENDGQDPEPDRGIGLSYLKPEIYFDPQGSFGSNHGNDLTDEECFAASNLAYNKCAYLYTEMLRSIGLKEI